MAARARVFRVMVMWAAALGAAGAARAQSPSARQVAAPASDILAGVVRLPDPASTPTSSSAALLPLRFEREEGLGWVARASFPVERSGELALALLSPSAASLRVFAGPAGAALRPIDEAFALQRRVGFAGDELPGWVIDRRDLRGAPAGEWSVRVESREPAEAWLLASAGTDLRAEAYVTTQRLVLGEPIGVAARAAGRALGEVARAQLVLDGDVPERALPMRDDGAHADGAAGDGLYGALLPEGVLGKVRARVELRGRTRTGQEFLRCAQVAFEVLGPRVALAGFAEALALPGDRLELSIGAVPRGMEQRFHVSAEVWGRDRSGREVPVCWLSRMLEPEARNGAWRLPLELDLRWLDVGGASGPLELRAVRVQDPDTEVVLDFAERLALDGPRLAARALPPGGPPNASTLLPPPPGPPTAVDGLFAPDPSPALMLVHGYCSSGSIWPAADFTQPKLEFLDPNANRSHDQFALLIAQRAQAAGLTSFGVVAHSQGGPAALHLLTYYDSGLEQSSGPRRIQSLASPYQGTPLASLGFFACGTNANMTPSGSATWLAGIPSWARAEVWTWTTSNSGSTCNFLTGLLLTDPEDGTVEKTRAELPGATNMGHTVGWCHTTGMTNPASYTDHSRNQAMNAAAAR